MARRSPDTWRKRTAWRVRSRLRQWRTGKPEPRQLPPGLRVYAIGDVHGRADLFSAMLGAIEADNDARDPARVYLIQLGDFIDRGPQSAELLQTFSRVARQSAHFMVLKGNHEATLNSVLEGDYDALRLWLEHGGREALDSWNIDRSLAEPDRMRELLAALEAAIPREERRWLAKLPTCVRIGDYYFVHAGVRPGVPLAMQTETDQLWIRSAFLQSTRDHGAMIVHGHSVEEEGPMLLPNRLGLDTGAYRTGWLSAVGLEGSECWPLVVGPDV